MFFAAWGSLVAGALVAVRVSKILAVAAGVVGTGGFCAAPASADAIETVANLSIEELMDLEVTSVSKRPERLIEAPAAIQVITGDDIRRSGAAGIPSALLLAGNLDVAQKNAHEWIISARGFSSDVGNKLLVLMDGRTVYTPLFSGVFWDRQDYVLEDIDRIEVISGPGGALWGANAVNGVINITTKSAEATQGLYAEGGGGTNPQAFVALRYGGAATPDVFYRVYGKYTDRRSEALISGASAKDSWYAGQGGFRVDARSTASDTLTLQGDIYHNKEGLVTGGDSTISGGNMLGRWSRTLSETADMSLQVYYDRTHLVLPVPAAFFAPAGTFKDDLDTIDVDFQHRFQIGDRHRLVWGLGYRFTHDVLDNAPGLAFFPAKLNQSLFSTFVQDEISLRDNVVLTLGTKLEHTAYTGFEYEPSARLQWSLSDQQTLWGAVSRAVRAPSRIDRDISQPDPAYLIVILKGGSAFKSETLLAYELGYRAQFNAVLGGALSAFYNDYDHLRSTSVSPLDPVFGLPFPFFFENNLEGKTYGFELSTTIQASEGWQLRGSYRLLKEDIDIKAGRTDFNNTLNETADPEHQFSVRSYMELPGNVGFHTGLRWVGKRTINNAGVPASIPSYFELDTRLAWDIEGPLEVSIAGRNLLHRHHPEYSVPGPTQVQIGRSVYGKLAWRM